MSKNISIIGEPGTADFQVLVDGKDVASQISSINIYADNEYAEVSFDVAGTVNADVDTVADFAVSETSRKLLIESGWTPPEDEGGD